MKSRMVIMSDNETSSPVSLSTKIDLKWLLVVTFCFGVLLGTESYSRASFEAESRSKATGLGKAIEVIQKEVKDINTKITGICVDVAVIKNDYKHVVGLLEDLKKEIKTK